MFRNILVVAVMTVIFAGAYAQPTDATANGGSHSLSTYGRKLLRLETALVVPATTLAIGANKAAQDLGLAAGINAAAAQQGLTKALAAERLDDDLHHIQKGKVISSQKAAAAVGAAAITTAGAVTAPLLLKPMAGVVKGVADVKAAAAVGIAIKKQVTAPQKAADAIHKAAKRAAKADAKAKKQIAKAQTAKLKAEAKVAKKVAKDAKKLAKTVIIHGVSKQLPLP